MRSYHVCFEGMPGSGKTTQSKIFKEKLKALGLNVEYVKSPNGNIFGKKVTNAIFSENPSELATIFAFLACYCNIVDEIIEPLLENNIFVVSDKGLGTSYVHTLYRNEGIISEDLFDLITGLISNNNALYPDLTIFLDIPIMKGFNRKEQSKDRTCMDLPTEDNIREAMGYKELLNKFPNWVVVDGTPSVSEVSNSIWSVAKSLIARYKDGA